jgi:hypothetical protein
MGHCQFVGDVTYSRKKPEGEKAGDHETIGK